MLITRRVLARVAITSALAWQSMLAQLLMLTQPCRLDAALQGYLIPQYHIFYWMGLRLDGFWPNFVWMDPNILGPTGYYEHWGTDASNVLEPNDMQVGLRAGCSLACTPLPSDATCTGPWQRIVSSLMCRV
jgi:hypothetical protein